MYCNAIGRKLIVNWRQDFSVFAALIVGTERVKILQPKRKVMPTPCRRLVEKYHFHTFRRLSKTNRFNFDDLWQNMRPGHSIYQKIISSVAI
jgi:hypothetical protein